LPRERGEHGSFYPVLSQLGHTVLDFDLDPLASTACIPSRRFLDHIDDRSKLLLFFPGLIMVNFTHERLIEMKRDLECDHLVDPDTTCILPSFQGEAFPARNIGRLYGFIPQAHATGDRILGIRSRQPDSTIARNLWKIGQNRLEELLAKLVQPLGVLEHAIIRYFTIILMAVAPCFRFQSRVLSLSLDPFSHSVLLL